MSEKEQQDLTSILAEINIFDGLDKQQREVLAGEFRVVECQAGDELMTEGVMGNAIYVILEGGIDVILLEDNSSARRFADITLAAMGPGELFGEYSFIDMRPASATVVATHASKLLKICYNDLSKILNSNNDIASRFYANLLLVLINRLRIDDSELDLFTIG